MRERRLSRPKEEFVTYDAFFERLTGHPPFPYQARLSHGPLPDLIDVPTGLGKTAAVLCGWLWRTLHAPEDTPTRLVYMLPMRSLVQQTAASGAAFVEAAASDFEAHGLIPPTVHVLMGGDADESWELHPERPALVVGTQDMLLSRALNRGYGMSRYKWPVHFALLNNDAWWVLDETQLMGVGIETSAQLCGLRQALGTHSPTHTTWMSATLSPAELSTVDHPMDPDAAVTVALDDDDRQSRLVTMRTRSSKQIEQAPVSLAKTSKADLKTYCRELSEFVVASHVAGTLTLVVLNRVDRAQALVSELLGHGANTPIALIHSRFRRADRMKHEEVLFGSGDRIVVATQAIEAGVDVSAQTLITELAPWSSVVQRLGRCNRYGEQDDARAFWIDIDEEGSKGDTVLPYGPQEFVRARAALETIEDAGPESLAQVHVADVLTVRPVLRRTDLIDLFDTTPDLTGNDLDVSRFIRDSDDTDVLFFWRQLDADPDDTTSAPEREELCRVSLRSARDTIQTLWKKKKDWRSKGGQKAALADKLNAWTFDTVERTWIEARRVRPGQTILLTSATGAYTEDLGWTGEIGDGVVAPLCNADGATPEAIGDDPLTNVGRWVPLTEHLGDAEDEAGSVATELGLDDALAEALCTAARWHDVGKAHPVFQTMLLSGADAPTEEGVQWAKSAPGRGARASRPYFRHELASALAWHGSAPDEHAQRDLIGYLIGAHHGKVRLSIRALPGEHRPHDEHGKPQPGRRFARGIWDGDVLPRVDLPDGSHVGPLELDLNVMELGVGSWLDRALALRDDPSIGPFRLALLEAALRIADWRASALSRSVPTEEGT